MNNTPTTDPTLAAVLAVVRTLAAMVGGWMIGKGWLTADQAGQLGGAGLVLLAGGFGVYSQWRNKQQVKTALTTPVPTQGTAP